MACIYDAASDCKEQLLAEKLRFKVEKLANWQYVQKQLHNADAHDLALHGPCVEGGKWMVGPKQGANIAAGDLVHVHSTWFWKGGRCHTVNDYRDVHIKAILDGGKYVNISSDYPWQRVPTWCLSPALEDEGAKPRWFGQPSHWNWRKCGDYGPKDDHTDPGAGPSWSWTPAADPAEGTSGLGCGRTRSRSAGWAVQRVGLSAGWAAVEQEAGQQAGLPAGWAVQFQNKAFIEMHDKAPAGWAVQEHQQFESRSTGYV